MTDKFNTFNELHFQKEPLLIGNVWDASSAQLFEKMGFKAIATSSSAVADTLGEEDGENIPFEDYLRIVKGILAHTSLPLSVDLESGYASTPEEIVENIKRLFELGVVGINLEDSKEVDGKRSLVDANLFSAVLKEIAMLLNDQKIRMFINLRSDPFLLQVPNALEESLKRVALYEEHVSGIFLPFINEEDDIAAVTEQTDLPLNVLSMKGLPQFDTLQAVGVKRISIGGSMYNHLKARMQKLIHSIQESKSVDILFE
ncbi:MAG: isocitrate lyase/phosphoenolpyruvate mutase family protein [Cyclobacteriaceae bacterium]